MLRDLELCKSLQLLQETLEKVQASLYANLSVKERQLSIGGKQARSPTWSVTSAICHPPAMSGGSAEQVSFRG